MLPFLSNTERLEERDETKHVVSIVGYSLRAPNCSSVPEFATALKAAKDLTTSRTRYPSGHLGLPPRQGRIKDSDFASFDSSFFGLSHKQAQAMDPLIRMLLEVSYESLLDAKLSIKDIRGSKTGVYVGHCFSDDTSHQTSCFNTQKNGYELVNGTNSMAANRLSYFYDFKGPSLVIDTACSSSLVALHYAMRDLKQGIIDRAIVAGLSLTLNPHKNACFAAFKMLSPTGHCHVFDTKADGYCRSDGVACIVLERGTNEGYAVVAGTGVNSDGFKTEGITYPSAEIQAKLMEDVFEELRKSNHPFNIAKENVSYHEAHGTGTVAGDREELAALSKVYQQSMVVGSVKSNMGHAEGASGLMGIIKILLMMEDKSIYPNYGFEKSPHLQIQEGRFNVVKKLQEWTPTASSISSFGFGGTNSFAILLPPVSQKKLLLPGGKLRDVPFASSKTSRPPSLNLKSFYAQQNALGNHKAFKYNWNGSSWCESSPLVYVFNGQGSQWGFMGQDLIETSQPFRSTMERLQASSGLPLVELYKVGNKWLSKDYSTIGIVSFQLGLLAILRDYGIKSPDLFLGHSVGELCCPFAAGLVSEEEVLQHAIVRTKLTSLVDPTMRLDIFKKRPTDGYDYIMKRNHSQEDSSDVSLYVKRNHKDAPVDPSAIECFSMHGQMVVVGSSASEIESIIKALGLKETCVACFNAPLGQTVSGPSFEVEVLVNHIQNEKKGIFIRKINTDSIAYHAMYLKVFREYLKAEFEKVRVRFDKQDSLPLPDEWISTSRNTIFGSDYLVDNILRPVYFQKAIEVLPKGSTIVEIGPSSILLSQIKRIRSDLSLLSLIEKEQDTNQLQISLRQLKDRWTCDNMIGKLSQDEDPSYANVIHYSDRYPQLWGQEKGFHVMSWEQYELPERSEQAPMVSYDLTQQPWITLRDHLIRGQNLFPAVGFVHAMWSGLSFKKNVEILDFRIHAPLVISPMAKSVNICLHKAGANYELWDENGKVRHASANVRIVESTSSSHKTQQKEKKQSLMLEGKHFYPHVRKLGYEYGNNYQLIDQICATEAYLTTNKRNLNWISYMDGMLHLMLMNESCFGYPVAFDRVFLREDSFVDAPLWALRLQEHTILNDAVIIEGIRQEYLPVLDKKYTIHQEVFIEYCESNDTIDMNVLASLICRESKNFSIRGPIVSTELTQLVELLKNSKIMNEEPSVANVVLSDSCDHVDACLVLTTDTNLPKVPHTVVARWGNLTAYRYNVSASKSLSLPIVDNWEEAVRMSSSGPFVWKSIGSSGAVASLAAETDNQLRAISYEGVNNMNEMVGMSKGMHHNYIREDGSHGIYVNTTFEDERTDYTSAYVYLKISRPGHLSSLVWEELDPSQHSVEITVATLNFRDVMRALGQLKERDLSLGLEFSGYDKETKRRVFGVAKNSLGTHCSPMYSFPTPKKLSDKDAATIPVVYLTAYYALFHKANLKKGQSVLIHAGTGGVGMAAIRLAKSRGLKIFTTCSSKKRTYLKETFGLNDSQIGDSRSDAFVQTIMEGTNQSGVDAAINQLSGSLQIATLRCMAPGGHFCEIGKYDIVQNNALGQGLLAANISFHAIDLLPLLCDPKYKPLWDGWLSDGFTREEIVPLPTIEFDPGHVEDAFRFMSQAKHMGKIIITGLNNSQTFNVTKMKTTLGQTHLITGGLGGLGLSIACRLAADGCKKLYLIGRRGVTNAYQKSQLDIIKEMGCRVTVISSDLLDLKKSSLSHPDIIWHVATVYRDMMLSEMTKEAWDLVVDTKVKGYNHLREIWPSCRIVTFSSVAAYFGNALQTSYALANASLDALARKNSSKTLSIRLGPLDNVGFITKRSSNRIVFDRLPFEVMNIDGVIDSIMQIVAKNKDGVFSVYDLKKSRGKENVSKGSRDRKNIYTLKEAQTFVSVILGGSPDHYLPTISLKESGLDSLSTMEVVNYIHEQCGNKELNPSDITDQFTVQSIVDVITAASGKSDTYVDDVEVNNNKDNAHNESNKNESSVDTSSENSETTIVEHIHLDEEVNEYVPIITIQIAPVFIDFDAIISALKSAEIVVMRQSDQNIFNHGAPIDLNDDASVSNFMEKYVALTEAFESTRSTVVAVIEGEVRGGGMLFPAAADVCIATSKASFGLPEIHRNMVPSVVSKALVERLGQSVTRRLCLTGESFKVEQAQRIGLVDQILDANDIDQYVSNMVRRWNKVESAARFIKSESQKLRRSSTTQFHDCRMRFHHNTLSQYLHSQAELTRQVKRRKLAIL